jgi:hypothetical protein
MQQAVLGRLTVVGLLVCGIAQAGTSSRLMVPDVARFTALGGVEIVLQEALSPSQRLVFVVRGAELTGIPRGLPITFHFDASVQHVVVTNVSSGLSVQSSSSGHTAICILTRDPFMPPTPWRYTVQIQLASLPQTGRISIGALEGQEVNYQASFRLHPPRQ